MESPSVPFNRPGDSDLVVASRSGNLMRVEQLVEMGANVNITTEAYNYSPLFAATQQGHINIVKYLVDHDADVNAVNGDQHWTSLHLAAEKGLDQIVKILLDKGARVNVSSAKGITPLMLAAHKNHLSVAQMIYQHGADINATSKAGENALTLASLQLPMVRWLLDIGLPVDHQNETGFSMLHHAVKDGCYDIVRLLLLEYKAKVEIRTTAGNTPVMLAPYKSNVGLIQLLYNNGANIHAKNNEGQSVLHLAVIAGSVAIFQWLMEQGVNVRDTASVDGTTLLHLATNSRKPAMAELLINKGMSVDIKDNSGKTPLMQACINGDENMVECLLQAGANPDCVDVTGKTAADLATAGNETAILHILQFRRRPEKQKHVKSDKKCPQEYKCGVDDTKKTWVESQKLKLAKKCVMRVLMLGETEAGKTSLFWTLFSGEAFMTKIPDRTIVVECRSWVLPNGKVIPVYDLGGHEGYLYCGNFFLENSPHSMVLLCQDIMSDDYKVIQSCLKSVLALAPECTVVNVLTKSDTVPDNIDIDERKEKFIKNISQFLQKEVDVIESNKSNDETMARDQLIKRYKAIKDNLENDIVYVTTCKNADDEDTKELMKDILHWSEQLSPKEDIIPELYQKCYAKLGHLGVPHETEEPKDPVMNGGNHQSITEVKHSTSLPDNKHINDNLKVYDRHMEQTSSVIVAKSHVDITAEPRQKWQTISFHEVKKILQELQPHKRVTDEDTRSCLKCLRSFGLILWFPENDSLEEIVFNDISVFIDLLKSLFNHKMKECLQFQKLDDCVRKKLFKNNRREFEKKLKLLTSQGLFETTILKTLLQKYNLDNFDREIVSLLQNLHVGQKLDVADSYILFVPWYVESKVIPDNIVQLLPSFSSVYMPETNELSLTLMCVIAGNITQGFWDQLCVRMMQLWYRNSFKGENIAFAHGIWVIKDSTYVLLQYDGERNITSKLKTGLSTLNSMWKIIKMIHEEVNNLLARWPGIDISQLLQCPHCNLGDMSEDMMSLEIREDILESEFTSSVVCPNKESVMLPGAIMQPIPETFSKEERDNEIDKLKNYLKKEGEKQPQPPTIIQLDIIDTKDTSLLQLSEHVGDKWMKLGTYLGISLAALENIRSDYKNDQLMATYKMLITWRNETEGSTEDLKTTLKKVGLVTRS